MAYRDQLTSYHSTAFATPDEAASREQDILALARLYETLSESTEPVHVREWRESLRSLESIEDAAYAAMEEAGKALSYYRRTQPENAAAITAAARRVSLAIEQARAASKEVRAWRLQEPQQ